jgi:hypothetical protein
MRLSGPVIWPSDAVRQDREGVMRTGGYRIEESLGTCPSIRYFAGLDITPSFGDVSLDVSMPLPQEVITNRVDASVVMTFV